MSGEAKPRPNGTAVHTLLRDGTPVRIRAIRPNDKERLRSAFDRLSGESVYRRFFQAVKTLTPNDLRHLTEIDFRDHAALALTTNDQRGETFIGVARLVRVAAGADRAEMAIIIADAFQHRGAGTLLLNHLIDLARALGVRELLALMLEDNDEMLELLQTSGLTFSQSLEYGIRHVVLTL